MTHSMRRQALLPTVLLLAGLVASPTAQTPAVEEIINKANQSESTLITNIREFKPMVEVYIQNLSMDEKVGLIPSEDSYLLGRFGWRSGPRLLTVSGGKAAPRFEGANRNRDLEYIPDGFAAMVVADWEMLEPKRYDFTLVRREFLGEARCYVIDVRPKKDIANGFAGRIWVEDAGFNIVRFNGINRRIERLMFKKNVAFHVDSWRTNVQAGVWVPSYTHVEELDAKDATAPQSSEPRFKSQIKLWGYDTQQTQAKTAFTSIEISEPTIQDQARPEGQLSPVESQRRWEKEAEDNVLLRLEKAQLIGMPGDVEKVLETVLNNLLVTNEIALDRPVHARVLLTSPFESFTVGHTIVMSRGLVDVLPDEGSLAMMMAHELAHIVLGHPLVNPQFAFADRMMVDDEVLLKTLKTNRDARQETAADAKVLEMLKKSPYADKLTNAGLFLKLIAERSKALPNLIQPHIGDHISDGGPNVRLAELMQKAPELDLENLDQLAALPLGARLVLDPWTGKLALLRSATSFQVNTVREKVPLMVTPLTPYVKYAEGGTGANAAAPAPKKPGKK